MDVQFVCGKIDFQNLQEIDAIVCPTDSCCSGSGGLDQQIHQAAGPELKAALKQKYLPEGQVLITGGFDLGIKSIIHAAVPKYTPAAEQADALFNCYKKVLIPAEQATIIGRHPRSVAVTLLGSGSCGWSYAQSMDALWRAILAYYHNRNYLERIIIYYPSDISVGILDQYTRRASLAFLNRPKEWGHRLGLGLWMALMDYFDDPGFVNIPLTEFIREIQRFFRQKTGKWLCGDTQVYAPEWTYGQSSMITSMFATLVIPVLCSNLCKLGFPSSCDSESFVLPVTLRYNQMNMGGECALLLPYELLPELAALRKTDLELTEKRQLALDLRKTYYLTVYHYRNAPDVISHYSLDVETAGDSHYRFSEEAAQCICRELGYKPNALGAALGGYLKKNGGTALEALVRKYAVKEFHYD